MKIHIVQKEDTLWNLSKKYNVDFQALKNANSQLVNPDAIMPGMKIKIPVDKKQVAQSPKPSAPKEKLMTPYKQIPQKAQPVIKEDDQKPKQKVEKKSPFPKLPPMSINMPKLPNIHANQYNIDVEETQWSKQSMMLMPVMPYPMMFYPQQQYQQMPVQNPCQTYQDPAKFNQNYAYQQPQWPAQGGQSYAHNQSAQWGELDPNDQTEQGMTQQANQAYYPQQWQAPYYGNQAYPYQQYPQYSQYGTPGYQNYATYPPRDGSEQESEED